MADTNPLELRLAGMAYAEIGRHMKVSRQRAQQLLAPPPALRRFIVERAKGRCEKCGVLVGMSGHVHHRASIGMDCDTYHDVENLALLCLSCHRQTHRMAFKSLRKATERPKAALQKPTHRAPIIKVVTITCPRCKHEYVPRSSKTLRCPACFTRYK